MYPGGASAKQHTLSGKEREGSSSRHLGLSFPLTIPCAGGQRELGRMQSAEAVQGLGSVAQPHPGQLGPGTGKICLGPCKNFHAVPRAVEAFSLRAVILINPITAYAKSLEYSSL